MNTHYRRETKPAWRFWIAVAALLMASVASAGAQGQGNGRGNPPPTPPALPPTQRTIDDENARKARDEAMAAEMARLRAVRPKTSGVLPAPAINPAGDRATERPAPKSLKEVEERRTERAAKAEFTAEELVARSERADRQPDTIKEAKPDDVRLLRAKLAKEQANAQRNREGKPPKAKDPTALDEITALRAELKEKTGRSTTLPPTPTSSWIISVALVSASPIPAPSSTC